MKTLTGNTINDSERIEESGDYLYQRVSNLVRQRILNGEYGGSQSAVSERKLAEELQVSRVTVRRAISELITEGVLQYSPTRRIVVDRQNLVSKITFLTNQFTAQLFQGMGSFVFAPLAGGVLGEAADAGMLIRFVCLTYENAQRIAAEICTQSYGVLIYRPILSAFHGLAEQVRDAGIPVVVVDDDPAGFSHVAGDEEQGARRAVMELVRRGHHKIGLINGVSDYRGFVLRERGYRAALQQAGKEIDSSLIRRTHADASPQSILSAGKEEMDVLLRQGATAVFAASELLARGALDMAKEAGTRVPEDVAILSFGNSEFLGFCDPPLSTVDKCGEAIGRRAVQILTELAEEGSDDVIQELIPNSIVWTASTGTQENVDV